MTRRTEKRRRMALLYARTSRQVLEEEEHDGPHPLEDALGHLRCAEKILDSALKPGPSPETTEV